MQGYIHSLESFGTVDGPGVRYVVFFQGCPMRCQYCHNPDTWNLQDGTLMEAEDIIGRMVRNISFYKTGGLTATGGEPMFQLPFLIELFTLAKAHGIHTCLDTSGIMFPGKKPDTAEGKERLGQIDKLLKVTDLVMLDIKEFEREAHLALTGQPNERILEFARYLEEKKQPMWVRHVVVPGLTFQEEKLRRLGAFLRTFTNLEKIEVLPYHAMGKVKYDNLDMEYVLKDTPQLTKSETKQAEAWLSENSR